MKRGIIVLGLFLWFCISHGQCKAQAQDGTIRTSKANSTWGVNSTGSPSLILDTTIFSYSGMNTSNMFMFYDSVTNNSKIAGVYYLTTKHWIVKDTMQLIKIMNETITNDNIIATRLRDLVSELYKVNRLQLQYLTGKSTIERVDKQWDKIHTMERNLYNIK